MLKDTPFHSVFVKISVKPFWVIPKIKWGWELYPLQYCDWLMPLRLLQPVAKFAGVKSITVKRTRTAHHPVEQFACIPVQPVANCIPYPNSCCTLVHQLVHYPLTTGLQPLGKLWVSRAWRTLPSHPPLKTLRLISWGFLFCSYHVIPNIL